MYGTYVRFVIEDGFYLVRSSESQLEGPPAFFGSLDCRLDVNDGGGLFGGRPLP